MFVRCKGKGIRKVFLKKVITEILLLRKYFPPCSLYLEITSYFCPCKKNTMDKRIRIVWILTIITSLLMIGGQTYWLYNQYSYSASEYMQTLHKQILEAENKEADIRFQHRQSSAEPLQGLSMNMSGWVASKEDSLKRPEPKTATTLTFYYRNTEDVDSTELAKLIPVKSDSVSVRDTFRIENVSTELLFSASTLYTLQISNPFRESLLDSLLQLQGIQMANARRKILDTLQWKGGYVPFSEGLVYKMEFTYPYNPLKREALVGEVSIPLSPLLKQMTWLLMASFLLILLLVYCLVYQIRTIMEQRKVDEMRKGFVNTMIHELKRPVQTLKMCVAFLDNKQMRTDERMMDGVVQDAMSGLDNLSAYLSKVRELTRADNEHVALSIRTFDLEAMVEKLIRLNNAPADKVVHFETHFSETPLRIMADPVHIANCLSNLIENAVKYSGREVVISIEASLENNRLRLQVSDNGIGIPLHEQGRVFEKFYRAQNIPDADLPGIGLGLSYVKLMVEAHGGTIGLQSQPGKGTAFTIEIPQ